MVYPYSPDRTPVYQVACRVVFLVMSYFLLQESLAECFYLVSADVFVTKRMKSAQHELAQKDLEMLEEFVAKQRAENVRAAGEHSEQEILEHARKMVDTFAEEAGPSSASEQKEIRKVAGRSAMDQVSIPHFSHMLQVTSTQVIIE